MTPATLECRAAAATPATDRIAEAARRIGDRLAKQALWQGNTCTWSILTPSPARGSGLVPALAGGALYQGTAGIAVFLAELYRLTGEETHADAARGALLHALRQAAELPTNSFGLYSGRTGIAYALLRAGEHLQQDFADAARTVLGPLAHQEGADLGLDVIAGAAGAIPALLWMSPRLGAAECLDMAGRLAHRLAVLALRHPGGWSWGELPSVSRNLCGYSHGAAGFATAFLELYRATGDGGYRFAAEQALLYESRFFDSRACNWPDLRHRELTEYISEGRLEELRARLRSGDRLARVQPGFMSSWCHGAPGIGLSRLRAYQITGDAACLEEARAAIRTTRGSLSQTGSYSLCHGKAGNCETLLLGAEVLGDVGLWKTAATCAVEGIERYEDAGIPWPSGLKGAVADPSLLLGEAGVGMFCLRIARRDVDSVLLVRPPGDDQARTPADDAGYCAARERAVHEYFGATLRLFTEMGVDIGTLLPPVHPSRGPSTGSAVESAYSAITRRIAEETGPAWRERLDDAFRLERETYDLVTSAWDNAEEYLDNEARLDPAEVPWEHARFILTSRARLVTTVWNWPESAPHDGPIRPAERTYLLRLVRGRVQRQTLTQLAAVVLSNLTQAMALDELVAATAVVLRVDLDTEQQVLRAKVRQQLEAAYRAGLIVQPRQEASAGLARAAAG